MLVDVLRDMYAHDAWANERILATAEQLTPEQLIEPDDTPSGSVRGTLLHIFAAHKLWFSLLDGTTATREEARQITREFTDPDRHPDIESLKRSWRAARVQSGAYLAGMTDELAREIRPFRLAAGSLNAPVWKIMLQVAIHGAQHRSEVALKLTNFGHSPGDLDFIFYELDAFQKANP